MASFNVPCPSCESSVLIKSDALIGKKVECPKCKYRFKVEEPSEDGGDAKPKKKKEGKKAAKKSKGGSGMLVGGLLGVLAIGLLAVGAYFLFFNDKGTSAAKGGSTTSGSGSGGSSATGSPDSAAPNPGGDGANPGAAPGQPAVNTSGPSDKDFTNLLPGETTAVYRVNMDRFGQSQLYGAFFDKKTLDDFKNSLSFEVGDIETFLHCIVGPDRYNFDVFRLKRPLELVNLIRRLDPVPGPQGKIKGHYYGTLKSNAFINSLGRALSTEALFGETGLPVTPEDKKRWGENKPSAFCLYDSYTLIIAEESTLERFLHDLTPNGYPPYRTELTQDVPPPDAGSGAPDGPGGPGGPGGEPGPSTPGKKTPGTTDSLNFKNGNGKDNLALMAQGRRGGRGGDGGGGGQGGPGGGGQQPLPPAPGTAGGPTGPGTGSPDGAGPGGQQPGRGAPRRRNYTSIPTYRTIDESIKAMLNRLEEDTQNPPFAVYAEKLDRRVLLLRQDVLAAASAANSSNTLGAFTGLLQNASVIGAALHNFARDRFKGEISFSYNTAEDARDSSRQHVGPLLATYKDYLEFLFGTRIDIRGGNGGGGGGPGVGGPGGVPNDAVGGPGAGPGGVTGPGAGGGGRGSGPPPGFGGGAGGPGGVTGPGADVGTPDGAGPGGFQGGFPGAGRGQSGGSTGSGVDIALNDKAVNVNFDIHWNEEKYKKNIYAVIAGVANQLKGRMAVLSGETTWHDLAAAFEKIAKANKPFPRGTADRDIRPERFGLPFPPEHRASFLVELLPYIGKGGLRNKVDEKKHPWYAKENLPAAEEWVPEFLVPYYPQNSWRAFHPLAENHVLGATNFVALAGLGLDAGRYDPANPEHAKKVGITGYDWGSKPQEITDGLSNTLYMIQVKPGGLQRPWIAGGGATVVGVDDKAANPVEDFAHTTPDNKRGNYVLMADGSVRWVNDTIDKKVFLAMVTRAGGETLADLDAKAPKVAGQKKEVEIKGGSPDPKPESTGGAKPADAAVDADELKKFQGEWKVTFAVMKGQKIPKEALDSAGIQMKIDGTRVDMIMMGKNNDDPARILRIDPKTSPKSMDMKGDKDKDTDLGLYEFVGEDKIKLRFATDGAKRPTEVRIPDEGSKETYVELERIK